MGVQRAVGGVQGVLRRAETVDSLLVQAAAIALAAYSYATLPTKLVSVHSNTFTALRWASPALWAVFFASILVVLPPARFEPLVSPFAAIPVWRRAAGVLIWLFGLAQLWVIGLLVHFLLHKQVTQNGTDLIHIAARIEGTTIAITAFIFWLLDSGGPIIRQREARTTPDFLWPQLESPEYAPKGWRPSFLDYLYVSFTNASAFSPTDTLPLSRWAKMLMLVQSAISLSLAVMVVARAVNILK